MISISKDSISKEPHIVIDKNYKRLSEVPREILKHVENSSHL